MMLSLCNEVLGDLPFAEQCRLAQSLGYGGLELAPFTVSADPSAMTMAQAQQLARIAQDHGLVITGLHWLLVKPEGLSITHPEAAVRHAPWTSCNSFASCARPWGGAIWCMARPSNA